MWSVIRHAHVLNRVASWPGIDGPILNREPPIQVHKKCESKSARLLDWEHKVPMASSPTTYKEAILYDKNKLIILNKSKVLKEAAGAVASCQSLNLRRRRTRPELLKGLKSAEAESGGAVADGGGAIHLEARQARGHSPSAGRLGPSPDEARRVP
ncbi:type III restriction protein res subunit, partial [Striga asiatica]